MSEVTVKLHCLTELRPRNVMFKDVSWFKCPIYYATSSQGVMNDAPIWQPFHLKINARLGRRSFCIFINHG